ncbi:MAG TPA: hypothetical protein VJ673_05395 [Aromatoleum sp.]|uniref:hypothetical protein n=1 Tax=Aromatoleum sp. TaxID=2307007 RepID=UPI002B489B36|nr:hypothetical protein [Aromatoleum sp.]HJV25099.1 hypothetical protein [Aromatoleum sp.]
MTATRWHHVLPLFNIAASGLCFLSIGYLFGLSELSDTFFLILAIQSVLGALFQSIWHAAIPIVYDKSRGPEKSIIITTVLVNLMVGGGAYFGISFVLEGRYPAYLNGMGAIYFAIFQIHLFFKQLYLVDERLGSYYLIDALGYFLSLGFFVALAASDLVQPSLDALFGAMAFGWMVVLGADLFLNSMYLNFAYSKSYSLSLLRKGVAPRIASLLYSGKDVIVPICLRQYGADGFVTLYAYVARVALSLYQVIPLHIVNKWVSGIQGREALLSEPGLSRVAKKAAVAYLLACAAASLVVLAGLPLLKNKRLEMLWSPIALAMMVSVVIWLAIQSFEQPYARAKYLLQLYRVQIRADVLNFGVFCVGVVICVGMGSVVPTLAGLTLSQCVSLWVYRKA